ncbi:hypothetical protein ACIO6T_31050 [Streptomyces sp. NPDC087532]|uniref:hypothetical protein n=1 Tax=Streptomyces sp. NPDC087532 TaxID=3365795 RepID=UPI00382EB7BA
MTTAPQPNRPADTSTTVAELATILDTVALIRFTEPREARSGRTADAMTHWLTGVNRVSEIPTRDGTTQYEIANSGFSRHLPGDHSIDVWFTPAPAPAPAPYAAPAPAVQQYAAAPQQQYVQPAAPAPAAQPRPQYVPQPAAPQPPGERTAAPWMNPQPQAPAAPQQPQPQAPQQPAAPAYPGQGHYPQQPQQGGATPGMR